MIGVRRETVATSEVDINRVITPMLDLAFQVLLFFIFTYHPSQVEEGQMNMTLPDAAKAQAETPQQANPKDSMPGEPELPSEVTVNVKTQQDEKASGKISQISVQDKVSKKDVANPRELLAYLKKL